MNPVKDSRWRFTHAGQYYDFTIVGQWFTGVREKHKVNTYEILADNREHIQMLPAERMEELINEGKIKPI